MMRIGYFGDGRWAHQALGSIVETSDLNVACIVARHHNPDPVLKDWSEELSIPFFAPKNVNASSFLSQLKALEIDINVSMSYNQILRSEAIQAAPKGFINCHAGALPFYRGRNILNWALINGEDRFGVTVHYVDDGIDTGDIIAQRFGVITTSDTYASLLDKAVGLCSDALIEALYKIQDGTFSATPQEEIHPVGFYCSNRREGDEWIDWSWTTERIYNLIRALVPPGPGARTLDDGHPVVITDAEKILHAPSYIDRPGTVVGREKDGIIVKTGDTSLKVKEIANWNQGVEHRRVPQHRIGTTFGLNLIDAVSRLQGKVAQLEDRLSRLEAQET
jgi:methionyl-tRNA formyltransferase